MDEDKGIRKIEKLNIKSIKNLTRIIIKTPEIPKEKIEKLFTDDKINLIQISDNLYLIEAKKIPFKDFEKFDNKICNIVEEIKKIQMNYYDDEEARDKISFPDEITEQISKFIVEVNKKGTYDVDKVALVLQNILGDIYQHPEVDKSFLDRKSIEYLAKASVSKIMEEAKINLTEALREILINIRKLFIAWIYDQCSISIINYETDRKEVSIIRESDLIEIQNKLFQKISLPKKWGARLDILYDASSNSIITSNFGKDKIKEVLPFVYLTVFDQILFHIRLETFEIERRALENIERSIIQDLNKLDPFEKTSVDELKSLKDGLATASDFFCKLLNNQVNHMKSENRKIKLYYKRDYTRTLSNQLMKGPISKSIFALTPLRNIEELDIIAEKLERLSYRFSSLSGYVIDKMNSLIGAKKENNPTLYEKIKKEVRDFIIDFLAKYSAEMSKS
jgi:hypothetical protein